MSTVPRIIVVSGLPGAGKSTIGRLLAESLPPAAHVEADRLHELIVSGAAWPDVTGTSDEAARQLKLRLRNAALLARSFVDAGFTAIIDDIVIRERYGELVHELRGAPFSFVMLLSDLEVMKNRWRAIGSPYADAWDWIDEDIRQHTPRVGLWIDVTKMDARDVATTILSRLDEAIVQ